jgi:hypothetical protein
LAQPCLEFVFVIIAFPKDTTDLTMNMKNKCRKESKIIAITSIHLQIIILQRDFVRLEPSIHK